MGRAVEQRLRIEVGRELRGSVHAKDGTPIGGARISANVEPSLGNLHAMTGQTGRRSGTSGDDGTFSVTGLGA